MQNKNTWIDVKERLPEANDSYLVTAHNIEDDSIYVTHWKYNVDTGWDFLHVEEIIAWMPMPIPFGLSEPQDYDEYLESLKYLNNKSDEELLAGILNDLGNGVDYNLIVDHVIDYIMKSNDLPKASIPGKIEVEMLNGEVHYNINIAADRDEAEMKDYIKNKFESAGFNVKFEKDKGK